MDELIQLYKEYWKRYTDFEGYTSVRTFWLTVLVTIVVSMVVGIFGRIPIIGWLITGVFGIATLIPNLSLAARRLRDGGYNPLWLLILLVPCIGWITIVVLCCMPTKA